MFTETTHTLNKRILNDDCVTLEVKQEDSYGIRYTISVGPQGNKSNTRLDLSESNWQLLLGLIAKV